MGQNIQYSWVYNYFCLLTECVCSVVKKCIFFGEGWIFHSVMFRLGWWYILCLFLKVSFQGFDKVVFCFLGLTVPSVQSFGCVCISIWWSFCWEGFYDCSEKDMFLLYLISTIFFPLSQIWQWDEHTGCFLSTVCTFYWFVAFQFLMISSTASRTHWYPG